MENKLIAFADEFGTNSFDFEGQGTHFIVATVIVKESESNNLRNDLEEIRKRHFQTGEIKSSKVASNHKRRIKILQDICKLDFSIYAVIVDKRKLFGEGFKYKPSFYKFLNGLLYKELYRTFPKLTLKVDEHGSNDYMKSFKAYVEKNHIRSLFSGSEFLLENSKGDIILQLADFIVGTLGYCFDELKISNYSADFRTLLEDKAISFNFFPSNYDFAEFIASNEAEKFNSEIAELCYKRALDFIDTTTPNDQEAIDQINCLKLLLLYLRSSNNNRFIATHELRRHLNINRTLPIKEQYFRTRVIGKMRDKGVLIASSSKGYKLPTCAGDLMKFINHGNRMIIPMVNRIQIARDAIKLVSNNEIDLLESDEFQSLKNLIDIQTSTYSNL
ncbi:DUF3800 domain-containing protein [Pontibacter populi]|uniref:DUF3800 domain-containing protein n=1 Tax=Pontibacter populi TaxID=890055 RepID=A0ABV1RY13_9BACT